MNLQDEVISKYTRTPDKDIHLVMAGEMLKAPATEKTYRDAFVYAAAAYFCDKELLFEGKPLLLKVIEITNKLIVMAPKNTEYKELYSFYIMMSLANYADMLNHELLPLALFKQIPLKTLQLQILTLAKLHSDWTLQEQQTLLTELAKNTQPKEQELLDLARINLAMRYCKIDDLEKAGEQIKLLLANKSNVAGAAADFINYLKTESTTEEVGKIAAMLSSDKDKQLNAFYQHCQVRLLLAFQRRRRQEDTDLYISFSTGGDPALKQLIANSIATAASSEKYLPASNTTQSIDTKAPPMPAPARVPPPIPSTPASLAEGKGPPIPPPRKSKPEGKAKTMSREAGKKLMEALHKRSGYSAVSPLSGNSVEQQLKAKPVESEKNIASKTAAAKPAESESKTTQPSVPASADSLTILQMMASALETRRTALQEHSDSSDNEDDVSWDSDDDKPTGSAPRKISESAQARPLPSTPMSPSGAAAPKTATRSGTRPNIMSSSFFNAPPQDASAKPAAEALTSPRDRSNSATGPSKQGRK